MNIAIVAVAYNRVNSLARLLDSLLSANYPNKDIPLIISIDKSDTDEVEVFAENFKWPFGEKIVKKHSTNLGLRKHMLSQGKELEKYDAIIVLEDDVSVAESFYSYASAAVEKYKDNKDIAGISLYSFPLNYHINKAFDPIKNEYDVFLMQTAQSWGEVWMRDQWNDFYNWYIDNQDFVFSDQIPKTLFRWEKSWLKYHTRYCIEKNKYFIYPYYSLSTNNSDVGTHCKTSLNAYQTVMQQGIINDFKFPNSITDAICYDGFFENEACYKALNLQKKDCCLDLYGFRDNSDGKRFWLTSKKLNYKIINSFGLTLRPIELNVLQNIHGDNLYLYDTHFIEKNKSSYNRKDIVKYHFRQTSILSNLREYGLYNLIKDVLTKLF